MLKKLMLILGAAAALASSCTKESAPENTVVWESLGQETDSLGKTSFTQRFTIVANEKFDRLAFCEFKNRMTPVNEQDTLIEIMPGYFAIGSERFANAAPGDTIVVDIVTYRALRGVSYGPDGIHLVADGKAIPVKSIIKPAIDFPEQWKVGDKDGMIYGDMAYAINDSLRSSLRPSAYMQIPTPKSVRLTGNMVKRPVVAVKSGEDSRIDYWTVNISGDTAYVTTNSRYPKAIAAMLERRLNESADENGMVPEGIIEDWADYSYRGFMLDVSRNFIGKEGVKRVLDLMARYGLNTLHFHLGDDEGWRLEMPSVPELTEVGARRGYTTTDDVPFLKQIYSGDGNPETKGNTANGYYTVADYIDILRYADDKGIRIIPEFDTPGHSRAAIRATEYRYRTKGDESLRLIHDGDTSVYTTAQDYHDNIMNPALDGPYILLGLIFDDIKDMYAQAGVELPAIHIGGDEVPKHAWDGSEYAQKLMADSGMTHQRELHAYFVERVAKLAAEHDVKIAGWQEIALDHPETYDRTVQPVVAAINCWTKAGRLGKEIAGKGYPLILSNVDYLYFDQTPSTHTEEPGLVWGGIVDEFRPLHATIDELCPGDKTLQDNVIGVSATLFSETVRSQAMVERYLLPRLLGLAERAHHAHETITDSDYFGALTAEMERWANEGYHAILRQPGIILKDGKIEMNDAYGFGEIRYTLDGSLPTRESQLYTGPFDPKDAKQIRARYYAGPSQSVTSILYL